MRTFSLSQRLALIDKLKGLVLGRQHGLQVTDLRVYEVLTLDHHNSKTGRCDPGYRTIARAARIALGTVGACLRRLTAAGFLKAHRRLLSVSGRYLRWTNSYEFFAEPRSGSRTEPLKKFKKEARGVDKCRSVAAQLQALAPFIAAERAAKGLGRVPEHLGSHF